MLNYGLTRTWCSYTTHKSNVQWISISFVWLYVFKCVVCMINCSLIKPKIFISVLFVFGSDFCHSCFESFSQKAKNFMLKNFVFGNFMTHFRVDVVPSKSWDEMGKFSPFENSSREFHDSFASGSRLKPNPWNENEEISISSQIQAESFVTQMQVLHDSNLTHESFPCAFAHFESSLWNVQKVGFKGLELTVFQNFIF